MKITKRTRAWGKEESFTIMDSTGGTIYYTSPVLANNDERTFEVCLPATTNSQYRLGCYDGGNDSWSDGAWIQLEGINGNTVFKGFMASSSSEVYPLSLYSPINKDDSWKYTADASGDWTTVAFSDNAWTTVTVGDSCTTTATGTQYFRKSFTGVANMAAIEMSLRYRYGVIAYINGVEVYRDNMPEGAVTKDTTSQGSYSSYDYHGIIRPSTIAEAASVLAVEVHFNVASRVETIGFNGFLSFYAGLSSDNKCYVVPSTKLENSERMDSAESALDWTRSEYANTFTNSYMTISFDSSSLPAVNGFRQWPHTDTGNAMRGFDMASASQISGPFRSIFVTTNNRFTSSQWMQWNMIGTAPVRKYMKLTRDPSLTSNYRIYAFQWLVCNVPAPATIDYPQGPFSYYKDREEVNIKPASYGYSGCSINPQLPAGLSIDADTCIISGYSTVTSPQTTYTVTSNMNPTIVTSTVTITVNECTGTMYKVLRQYGRFPDGEWFRFRDTSNDDILLEVPPDHGHEASSVHTYYLCITMDRFDLTVYCNSKYWYMGSYVYVYYMLPNGEEEMIGKNRYDANQSNHHEQFYMRPVVYDSEQWNYKMGSVPSGWTDNNVSGWSQGARGSFPASSNRIQLYKKTFNIADMSLVSGAVLSLRYKYGIIVYLNGHEVFRNHITGTLSDSSSATESYQDILYRVVTIPARSIPNAQETAVQYLTQGQNVIAIALVAIAAEQTTSDFDAVVRLTTTHPASHIWEFTAEKEKINYSNAESLFDMYYGTVVSSSTCDDNSITVTLNNDRREWVSSMEVQNYYSSTDDLPERFQLYARNSGEEWTLLKNVTGLSFSMPGQRRRIYFHNNKSYNQFKFANFGSLNCQWRVQSLDLFADNVMDTSIIAYPQQTDVFLNIEMAELIPEGTGYSEFTIKPDLPNGLVIDPMTGWISGTPLNATAATTYTVSATKFNGGKSETTFVMSAGKCHGVYGLMTVRVRADSYNSENSWKLFNGRDTTATPIKSVATFPVASNYYYLDFCYPHGIYTFQAADSYGDGWSETAGYTLTVDVGAMELEINQVPSGEMPSLVSTTFSTFFPFQIEETEWKVYQDLPPVSWNLPSFDDNSWSTYKAAEIPSTESVTTYIRKSFQLTNVDDYQVLNVRVKYTGGVVVYFNGNLVARLNINEFFDDATESIALHDATVFSKFHIILPTAGMQEGENVIAFEIHRAVGTSSSEPIVFDATGVFGVDDCSTVVDSFMALTSSEPLSGTIDSIMDLDPFTVGKLPIDVGTFVEWTVENLEGSKWNAFNMLDSTTVNNWGFMINAKRNPDNEEEEAVMVLNGVALNVTSRTKPQIAVPVALAGFRNYRWEIFDSGSTNTDISSMFTSYCKATGAVCPAVDNYPSVAEGQISPSSCPSGYRGYSYRLCSNGQLGEVNTSNCELTQPSGARYNSGVYHFVMGTASTTGEPFVRGVVTKWTLEDTDKLPAGLTLNAQTGVISGVPTEEKDLATYAIYGENSAGATKMTVQIAVRKGRCLAEGVFPTTTVGEEVTYACKSRGSYVGTQKRKCQLGEKDGEWQKVSGFCMSVVSLVVIIIVVIVVVVVIVLILVNASKKTKAVGGVKGKKTQKQLQTKSKPSHVSLVC